MAASRLDAVRDIGDLGWGLPQAIAGRPGITIYALHHDQAPKLDDAKDSVHIDTANLKPAIERARVIKTPYEIALIRRANAVSVS